MKIKLSIDLVPSSSWTNNVRAVVSQKQWDYLRNQVYAKAYHICEICGGVGPKHPVECHEIWSYDNKKFIQKLEGMIALCPDCHMVKHIGLAEVRGLRNKAVRHLMTVNKMTNKQAESYIADSFKEWSIRSQSNWALDLTHLQEYNIVPDLKNKQ